MPGIFGIPDRTFDPFGRFRLHLAREQINWALCWTLLTKRYWWRQAKETRSVRSRFQSFLPDAALTIDRERVQFRVILGLLSCLTRGRTPLRTVRFLAEAATDDEVLLQVCGILDQGRCDEPRVAIRLGENTEVLFD